MTTLHVGRPNIGDRARLLERIEDALDRRWLSNDGPFVKELEREIESLLGVQNCVVMCNGTIALEIAIRALGLKGEVIVPSFTFVATAHALQWQGIKPVFCDVASGSYYIDPEQIGQLVTPNTTGIIGVHTFGRVCDVRGLSAVADEYGLKLLYDAAHVFGCSHVGGSGNAEIFSFHATKFFNTFEGGAITTDDDVLAERVRHMRNFGFVDFDAVGYVGTNGKMSEISAAMGLTNLESLDEFVAINERNYTFYKERLAGLDGVVLMEYDEREKNNYQYIVVEVFEDRAGISRNDLMYALWKEDILVRRYFYPGCHRMEPYKSHQPHAGLLLPETEELVKRVLVLPTGTAVSETDVSRVCQTIKDYTH